MTAFRPGSGRPKVNLSDSRSGFQRLFIQRLVARSAREGKPLTTVATSLLADALRELPPGWSAEGR